MPTILHDDPHLIAVDKPAGLLTQGFAGGEPTLEDAVRQHLSPGDPGAIYLGTVHRLDRPVSGVVVWAKNVKAARRLAEQFATRRAKKLYLAVVEGQGGPDLWHDWLGPVDATGVARIVESTTPGARRAITRARLIAGATVPAGLTQLALEPETGRTHQLRAQASSRGLPILGDARYGSLRPFSGGIALHARGLDIEHPASRQGLILEAPLPLRWAEAGLVPPG